MSEQKPKIDRDIPRWVRWMAQDADGAWWGYEVEPHQHNQGWYENELGRCVCIKKESPNRNWQHSLKAYTPPSSYLSKHNST
jgi:hypothetical protein